ncbi:hypothetical protein DPMN_173834 [Dreissena polymorpha]|uniref:Uncharacterized protein n=1 Tax=Dreissena polymorpha TaxID=45954 RepID=A0A9D4E2C0_DREPO|nr:hypothetical protein DPMN_173834 [Dreissena polymorpha]
MPVVYINITLLKEN